MEVNVWKTRAFLIFIISICLAISISLFSRKSEEKPTYTAVLPSVPITQSPITNTQYKSSQVPLKISSNPKSAPLKYRPSYQIAWANPLNYGERFGRDVYGKIVDNKPIIVLHETVYSAASAINHFQTPHQDETAQASYHTLIKLDGTVVYLVPPEKRAFGATNSVFNGANGLEAVKTHPNLAASVNNFAYHVSLETPLDGRNPNSQHSGYTDAQYQSLAWLIAQSKVPDSRITTHKAVDRSGTRIDPRSFDSQKFLSLLHSYRNQLNNKQITLLN